MKTPLLLCALMALLLACSAPTAAQTKPKKITVLKLDNSVVSGEMVALNEQRVVVRGIDGRDSTIPIDDIYELIFDAETPSPPTSQSSAAGPTTNRVDPEVFARCLSAFRRILSAVEIGVTYLDYRRELLEAKIELDRAVFDLPESPQRTDLFEALEDLRFAAEAWQVGIQNKGIPTKTDFYRTLNTRYELGVDPRMGRKVDHRALLKIIWAKASDRLTHAISLQK